MQCTIIVLYFDLVPSYVHSLLEDHNHSDVRIALTFNHFSRINDWFLSALQDSPFHLELVRGNEAAKMWTYKTVRHVGLLCLTTQLVKHYLRED